MVNGKNNRKLNQDKFIDMDSLSRHSAFNVAARRVRKDSNSLVVWIKHGPNGGP